MIDIPSIQNLFSMAKISALVIFGFSVLNQILGFLGGIPLLQRMSLNMKDIKNCGAIKYVITDKIKDRSRGEWIRRVVVFYLEAFWVMIIMGFVWISLEMTVIYANNLNDGMEKFNLVILVAALVIGCFILFGGKKVTHTISKLLPLVLAVWISLVIIWLSVITMNLRVMYFAMLVSTLLMNGAIIFSLQINNWYRDYNARKINYFRVIRYILIAVGVSNCYAQLEFKNEWNASMYNVITGICLILACVEYCMIEVMDETSYAEIIVHTKEGDKITKNKIIYYHGDKVKLVLEYVTKEILDADMIDSITYLEKYPIYKRNRQDSVECFLKNGDRKKYSYYKLKNDKWILFFKFINGARESILLKTEDVEKVVEQK